MSCRRKAIIGCLVIVGMLCAPSALWAATYHTRPSGTAANCTAAQGGTGTSDSFDTIQEAVNCVANDAAGSGSIASIHAGTYTEKVSLGGHAFDGASGNPKILRAHPGDSVTWTISDGLVCQYTNIALYLQDVNYWRVEGFTFNNVAARATIRLLQTIDQSVNKSTPMIGIEILNNIFTNNGTNGIGGTITNCPGTTSGCASRQIYAQYLGMGAAYAGPDVNNFSGNTFTSNFGEGMSLDHTSDTLVSNNTSTGGKGSREESTGCQYQTNLVSGGSRSTYEDNTVSNMIENAYPLSPNVTEGVGIRFDVGQDDNLVRRNIIHDLGNEGPSWNGGRHFFGIFNENDSNNNIFEQNIIYNVNESCIIVGSTGTPIVQGITIRNNTLHNCGQVGVYLSHVTNAVVRNNIINGTGRAQVIVSPQSDDATGSLTFSHNDWYRGGSAFGRWRLDPNVSGYQDGNLALSAWNTSSGDTNSISADPLFVNAAAGNFNLCLGSGTPAGCTALSPAINAGTDVGLAFNGIAPDMGAVESGADLTPPSAPTNLRLVLP